MSKHRDRIIEWLDQFAGLDNRGHTDEIGWIALKLSCSRGKAERWIKDARNQAKTPARPKPPTARPAVPPPCHRRRASPSA